LTQIIKIITDKRTSPYALCPLDLCHSIGLWPSFSALRASTRFAASISACGFNFRPATLIFDHSGLNSIKVPKQHYERCSMRCSADDASPWWRLLYDVTANRCAQLCCGLRNVAARF